MANASGGDSIVTVKQLRAECRRWATVGVPAHAICDFITKCGGTVNLDNRQFNAYSHMLWDIWEAGYYEGLAQAKEAKE